MAQDFERTLKQNISNNSGSPTELRAAANSDDAIIGVRCCLLYTSPSPRDRQKSRMPSSA